MPDELDTGDHDAGAPWSGELREHLVRDGVVRVRSLLDETWCERLHRAIERCRHRPGPFYGVLSADGSPVVDSDLFRWSDDPTIAELTHASPIVACASALIGEPDVVLIEDQWFASAPGAVTASPWHQDEPYYRLDRPFLTIWVTLDDVAADASLRVVAGSHVSGSLFAPVEFSATGSTLVDHETDRLEPVPDVDADPTRYPVLSWDLRAGDAVCIDSRTLHATGVSAVPDRQYRRVSTRWAAPDTRYRTRATPTALFWDELSHGLEPGDPIAGDVFPSVSARRDVRRRD